MRNLFRQAGVWRVGTLYFWVQEHPLLIKVLGEIGEEIKHLQFAWTLRSQLCGRELIQIFKQ